MAAQHSEQEAIKYMRADVEHNKQVCDTIVHQVAFYDFVGKPLAKLTFCNLCESCTYEFYRQEHEMHFGEWRSLNELVTRFKAKKGLCDHKPSYTHLSIVPRFGGEVWAQTISHHIMVNTDAMPHGGFLQRIKQHKNVFRPADTKEKTVADYWLCSTCGQLCTEPFVCVDTSVD